MDERIYLFRCIICANKFLSFIHDFRLQIIIIVGIIIVLPCPYRVKYAIIKYILCEPNTVYVYNHRAITYRGKL